MILVSWSGGWPERRTFVRLIVTIRTAFDATGLPSGAYPYLLNAGDYVETKRMVVVK